jgi:hypothetical protein
VHTDAFTAILAAAVFFYRKVKVLFDYLSRLRALGLNNVVLSRFPIPDGSGINGEISAAAT